MGKNAVQCDPIRKKLVSPNEYTVVIFMPISIQHLFSNHRQAPPHSRVNRSPTLASRRLFISLCMTLALVCTPQITKAQLFLGVEFGTELHNDFKNLQYGVTQPYTVSGRINAGVIVNRWRLGVSESFSYTNPNATYMEGGFIQYGIELIEIDGAKLIDLYLGPEVYMQLISGKGSYVPIGILASTTLPSIVDLSVRSGYDVKQDRFYLGLSLGRNISKHTRPAGEKIPYPDGYSDCEYTVFNQTQIPIQTLFLEGDANPKDSIEVRFDNLHHFTRFQNQTNFLTQPNLQGAYALLRDMGLPELVSAIQLGLERSSVHQTCSEDFTPDAMLPVLWRRLNDSYQLIRDAKF